MWIPPRPTRPLLAVLLVLGLAGASAGGASAQARAPRAVLAFLPAGAGATEPVLDRLAARDQLALGLVSATQGSYSPEQTMLDISAGSRTSLAVYTPKDPPKLKLIVTGPQHGFILNWPLALDRADTALAEIEPGMLASRIPGGAAYAGSTGGSQLAAVVPANRTGDVGELSIGAETDIAQRVRVLLTRHRLVVASLPGAANGDAALDRLMADRRPGDLLFVMRTPPRRAGVSQLLPAGVVGIPGGNGALTSETTRLDGIVAAIDIPVTILRTLGLPVPDGVKGESIHAEGERDPGALDSIEHRLRVVNGRRSPAFFAFVFTWLALTLTLGIAADRRGVRAAMRIGGLAALWVPPLLLLTGLLSMGRLPEVASIVGGAFVLAALTDRFVPWPRGSAVPAAVSLTSYAIDLALGSPLIIRSLLGVNPRSGSRFYGLGNELEAALVVTLLLGLGALLHGRARSRASAAVFVVAGVVAGVFIGAGQLGADVGGVITLGAGIGAATVAMLPGRPSRRALTVATLAPVAALVVLAAVDELSGGNGHFTRTILHADSAGSLWDVIARRYTLAFNVLTGGAMPLLAIVAVLSIGYALKHRDRVYAALSASPSWRAALIGGLAASIAGALFNDSGPLLLVIGTFLLAAATAYIRGGQAAGPADPGR